MIKRRVLTLFATFSILLVACGQTADIVVSFDGQRCSLQARAVSKSETTSIEMINSSSQPAWFGIGRIPSGLTLDQIVEAVGGPDSTTQLVMSYFDPTAIVVGEHVPTGGSVLIWGDLQFEPGVYSVWCQPSDGSIPNPARTAGTFER